MPGLAFDDVEYNARTLRVSSFDPREVHGVNKRDRHDYIYTKGNPYRTCDCEVL